MDQVTYLVPGRHPLDMAVSLYHQGSNLNRGADACADWSSCLEADCRRLGHHSMHGCSVGSHRMLSRRTRWTHFPGVLVARH